MLFFAEAVFGKYHPDTLNHITNLEKDYANQGIFGNNSPQTGGCLNELGALFIRQERYKEAEQVFTRLIGVTETTLGKDHPDVATYLTNLAELFSRDGRYSEAEPSFVRALAITETAFGKDHRKTGNILNNLALPQAKHTRESGETIHSGS